MALELFKPFVINKLVERGLAHNVRGAGRLIEEETDDVWSILEEVIQNRYVLLNRAPTLHRLGIQAFQAVLIEGNAIQIHPIVCRAFNADFDGDQMAVHLPLGKEAQAEAKNIMLSSDNLLKPATGEPVAIPTKDMVLGCYWMTKIEDDLPGQGKIFANPEEALLAKHFGYVHLRAKIKVRLSSHSKARPKNLKQNLRDPSLARSASFSQDNSNLVETSVGRIIFNEPLPSEIGFINKTMNSRELRQLVSRLIDKSGVKKTALVLDKIKRMGFKYAADSGISWSMDDLQIPQEKTPWLKEASRQVDLIQNQYENGLLTDLERKSRVIEIWLNVNEKISQRTRQVLDPRSSVFNIFDSGARGSWEQLNQMTGMKGLVINPAGEIIELPIKSSYKEGFNVLEYFISTHGGRKGMADTALKTATAGYLTRRLVDVCQEVVIRQEDCGDKEGIYIYRYDEEAMGNSLASRIVGRMALETIKSSLSEAAKSGQVEGPKKLKPSLRQAQSKLGSARSGDKNEEILVKKGQLIDKETAQKIDKAGLEKVRVRSVIACQATDGICQKCYGYDLGRNELVKLGEAVGIVTAQAIGEPGTQLTLRTFHTGGVAGGRDITQGLPRVEEIFEARPPKGKAIISEVDGRVKNIIKKTKQAIIQIEPMEEVKSQKSKVKTISQKSKLNKKNKILEYSLPTDLALGVSQGDLVTKGQQLTEGHIDLKGLYEVAGQEAVQRYIIREVQQIYTFAGENINDKHIEMIIRQMFSRIKIKDPGSTNFLADQIIERGYFQKGNNQLTKNEKPAIGQSLLLGITKVSLTTDSFLSAASFQETTRVLIDASIQGKEDNLRGLKENVIIGKLIPAGTGFK